MRTERVEQGEVYTVSPSYPLRSVSFAPSNDFNKTMSLKNLALTTFSTHIYSGAGIEWIFYGNKILQVSLLP